MGVTGYNSPVNRICIYHGNCADGFSGAWVVSKALGRDIEFHAGVHNDPPPDVRGKDVVIVDFSYKRPVMEQIVAEASAVCILDHHASAIADLNDMTGLTKVFDVERAGSMIAWDYFFPQTPPPPLLKHIEDRDLARFALPLTREIQAAVFSHPYEFDQWEGMMLLNEENLKYLAQDGYAIERKHGKDIKELLKVVTRRMNIGGYNVPIANLPYTMTADAGLSLAEGEAFGACYWDTPAGRVFSLRSKPGGIDVAKIAWQYGGGGHPNASGFRLSFQEAAKLEV